MLYNVLILYLLPVQTGSDFILSTFIQMLDSLNTFHKVLLFSRTQTDLLI